jgi:hypothetical protein
MLTLEDRTRLDTIKTRLKAVRAVVPKGFKWEWLVIGVLGLLVLRGRR